MTRASLKDIAAIAGIGAVLALLIFAGLQMKQTRAIPFAAAAVESPIDSDTTARGAKSSLLDPLQAGWKGSPVCERLFEDSRQRILRCTFPPGVGHERHFHAPHFGYTVVGGRMQITDGNGIREVDIASGGSFKSEGVAWHEAMNIGSETTVFLIVESK